MRTARQSVVKPVYNFRNYLALILVGLFGVSGMLLGGWGNQTAEAAAGINKQLNFQGRLLNSSGAVVADGNYNLRFKVYQDGSGCVTSGTPPCSGTLMWTELWQNSVATGSSSGVTVRNGYFSVALGTFCAFSGGSCQGNSNTGVSWNQDTLWVSVDVGGTAVSNTPTYDGEMTPFRRLASSVYSLQAENANTLGGLSASQFIQTVPAVGVNVIAPTVASSVALTVKASTAGGTNSLEVFDSSNTRQAFFDASGNLNVARTIQPTTTNAVDVGLSGTQFRTGYFGTSVITPTIDTASAVTFNIGAAGSPTTSQIALNQDTQVAAGKNFSLASGTGTLSQTYTGTTGNALSVTANSLTSGRAVSITSSNNTAANTNWSGSVFGATNAQGTTAVTGLISGFDIQFTQGTSVAGNNETALNVAIAQNNSTSTDATVNSIINVANNDTATGNQITASRGISITGTNVTDGLYLNGTFGTNLINTSTSNFVVTQGGAGTFASTVQGTTLNGTTGINTGAAGGTQRIDASGNLVNIGNITGTGAVTLASGGAGALTLNSASNVLVLDATDTTMQRTAAGTYTINLLDGANTTLAVTNSGVGVANMTVDGGITATAAVQGATATFTGSSALTLGTSSTNTGAVIFRGSGGAGTLTLQGPTTPNGGNFTLTIPAITGNANVCTDNAICSGYAASSGSGSYIQNQIAAQQSSSNFWISATGRADTSFLTPTLDTPSGTTTLAIGTTNATAGINLNQDVVVAANKNLTLTSGTGRIIQTFTGTTTDATSVTANSLTTGTGLKVTTSNNTAANTNWSGTVFNPTNAQGTTAVTGLISGLDVQFTQAATVAGNTETVANFAITANASSVTDNTVNSIVRIQNNDTATGNQITATSAIQVDGANTTNGITFSGTFGNNLINTSTSNFTVAQSGALTSASTIQGTSVNGTTGINTGATGGTQRIDASGNLVNIGNITGTGGVTLSSGGAGAITLDSASNILVIAANDTTLQRTAAGTYTVNLVDGANTTLAVTNTGAGTASITADGDITASGNVQGVNVNGTTGVNTGAAGGTQRIDASGNLVNIGNITGTGAVTLSSGGAGALTLDSASNVLVFAATDATLQRTASGTTTLNLVDGANTTLAVTNSGVGNANITADGNITANGSVQGATGAFTGAGGITLGVTGSASGRIDFNGSTGASGTITLQAPANPATYSLTLPASAPGTSQCLQTDSGNSALLVFSSCGSAGTFLAKNSADTSSAAITASNFLYTFTNSSSAVASGVLRVDNGTNTNSALSVTTAGNPTANQAVIFASNTNASPTGNLLDLQAGSSPTSRFAVSAGGVVTLRGGQTADITTPTGTTGSAITVQPGTVSITGSASGADLTLKGGDGSGTTGSGGGAVTIQGGNATSAGVSLGGTVSIQAGTGSSLAGSINIGTTNNFLGLTLGGATSTGTITVGTSTASNTIAIGTGNTANGNTQTINIGNGTPAGTGATVINIGNTANNGNVVVRSGTGGISLNASTGAATPVNIATGTTTGTIGIGSTSAGAVTIASSTASSFTTNSGNLTLQGGSGTVTLGTSTALTASGALTVSSGGAGALSLDSASNIIQIAANDTTLQRTAAGTYTVNLVDGANTTLAVTNTGAGAANITADGNITATGAIQGATGVITAANGLTLGTSSSATGGIVFRGSGGTGTLTLQGPTTPNAGNFSLTIPAITGNANVCTDNAICSGYAAASGANYIAKNTNDTSSASFAGNLIGLTNTNAGAAGVLSLTNSGTNSALTVASSGNPSAGQALISATNTNGTPSGNLLDLRVGSTSASVFNLNTGGNLEQAGSLNNPYGGIGPIGNLLIRSEEFNNATAWTMTNITAPAADSQIAPDGSVSAESLVGTGASNANQTVTTTVATTYTFSVWLKQTSGAANTGLCIFSTAGTPSACSATAVTPNSNTWQRFSVTQTITGSPTAVRVQILPGNGSTATVQAWGAQLVAASTPQVYTRTGATTVIANNGSALGGLYVQGIQPVAVSGNGTSAITVATLTGAKGGNTTGTTGQTAGTGGAISLTGGEGGDAPSGSTNGIGGAVLINGGAAGSGAGGSNFPGNVILQNTGGFTGIRTLSPDNPLSFYDPTTGDAAADVLFASTATNRKILVLQGLPSQTEDLMQFQSSNGVPGLLTSITAAGNIEMEPTANRSFTINNPASGNPGVDFTVQGSSGVGTGQNGGNIFLRPGAASDITGTGGAVIVAPGSDQFGSFQVRDALGFQVLSVDTTNNITNFGVGTFLNGKVRFSNSTNGNTIDIQSGVTSASYTLTLPTAVGSSGDCLKQTGAGGVLGFGACAASAVTLQTAYNGSAGASPSMLTTSANKAVTIQTANTGGIAAGSELFGVHLNNAGDTLGNSILTVNSTGIGVNIGGTAPTTSADITLGASTTSRTINMANNTNANGGTLRLQGAAGNYTTGSISYVASSITFVNNSASSTATFPAGLAAGDLMIMTVGHGWELTNPTGWNVLENEQGSNVNGALLWKFATSADVSAGSVSLTFAQAFYGEVAIGAVRNAAGIRDWAGSRSGTGATSEVVGSAQAVTGDLMVYMGMARLSSATIGVGHGTVSAQRTADTNAAAVIATETAASTGDVYQTFTIGSVPTGRYYTVLSITPKANAFGGEVTLQGGAPVSTGYSGNVVVKSQTNNSPNAFEVQKADGRATLSVNTVDDTVTLNHYGSDSSTIGAELYATNNFTNTTGHWGTFGANWNSSPSTQITHVAGNTSAITNTTVAITQYALYQVSFTLSGTCGTASDTITFSVGGTDSIVLDGDDCSGSYSALVRAGATTGMRFTPTTSWTGTISAVSIKQVTATASSILTVRTSRDFENLELRTGSTVGGSLFLGTGSGRYSQGTFNSAIGYLSMGQNTTGSNNTGLGYLTFWRNIDGSNNAALGNQALQDNMTGDDNTAIGYRALMSSRSGYFNVAVGALALQANSTGYDNNAVGRNSLQANTTGYQNTANGGGAMFNNTTGFENVAVGYLAGMQNITGSDNIFIGSNSGNVDTGGTFSNGTGLTNSTAIGANAIVQASNSMVLGSVDTQTKVGIGTTSPTSLFSVSPLQYGTGTAGTGGVASVNVTGVGTTWTKAMIGGEIIFADGTKRLINNVTSTTTLVVNLSATIAAGTNYRIHYYGFQVASNGTVSTQQTVSHAVNETTSQMTVAVTDATDTAGTVTSTTNGLNVVSTVNVTAGTGGTKTIAGINVSAPTLTACTGGSSCNWIGTLINTQSTGAAAAITQNGLAISSAGISAGALNAIGISGITTGAGAETAVNIGQGWDNAVQVVAQSAYTQTAALTGVNLDYNTNFTGATGQNITGIAIKNVPNLTVSTATTHNDIEIGTVGGTITNSANAYTFNGVKVTTPAITTTGGTATVNGLSVTTGNMTQTSGSATVTALNIALGTVTTGGTSTGLRITGSGTVPTTVGVERLIDVRDSSSRNLLEVRDMSALNNNFGAAVSAGAFIDRNSMWSEEFNVIQTNACSRTTTANAWKIRGSDGANNGAACTAGNGSLAFSSVLGVAASGNTSAACSSGITCGGGAVAATYGLERISATSSATAANTAASMEYIATTAGGGTASAMFTANNLPVMVAKVRPSLVNSGSNARFYVGLGDKGAASGLMPSNGIFFTNCSLAAAALVSTVPTCTSTTWLGFVTAGGSVVNSVACTAGAETGTINTTSFNYLRIEVRANNNIHFFVDTDTSTGIVETECGTGFTGTGPGSGGMSPFMEAAFMTNTATTENLDVDFIRIWQDDPSAEPENPNNLQGNSSDLGESAGNNLQAAAANVLSRPYDGALGGDISEAYPVDDPNAYEPGDVVAIDPTASEVQVRKSQTAYDNLVVGVISDQPNMVIGETNEKTRAVSVAGRVSVKASTENGEIKPGDLLTTSSQPGVAMKATQNGPIIGQALTAYAAEGVGKVLVRLNVTGHKPSVDATDLQSAQADQATIGNLQVSGDMNVAGFALFRGKVSIDDDLAVAGHIQVGGDTAGTVEIPVGMTSVDVKFTKPYTSVPVVSVAADDFVPVRVVNKTVHGFRIEAQGPVVRSVKLDWTALEPRPPE